MNVLEVERLSVAYGAIPAVEEVSLAVPEGGLVTVIGPNGAGKSTLLNAIMGVLPSRWARPGLRRGWSAGWRWCRKSASCSRR